MEGRESGEGWLASLRRLGDSVLALAQNRVELFAVELQEEKLRVLRLALWGVVALTLAAGGLLVVVGVVALFLWQAAGYWGLAGWAGVLLGLSAFLYWRLRQSIVQGPPPFADTLAEFRKDRECLRHRE